MNILLDLDGVCADFIGAACDSHGITVDDVPWHECGYYMERGMGLTPDEFWAPINARGRGFWSGLEPYPWLSDLLALIEQEAQASGAEVYVCTSPSRIPDCQAGKVEWIYQHLPPRYHSRFVFTAHKHLLANGHTVLIDDSPHNAEAFRACGGAVVLFPMPYNDARDEIADRLGYVRHTLASYLR